MPKRKTSPCPDQQRASSSKGMITLSSLDSALDLLANDTFTKLDGLVGKFENATGIIVDPSQARMRWEEAVKRYWVMKSMDELTCTGKKKEKRRVVEDKDMQQDNEDAADHQGMKDDGGRNLQPPHPGAIIQHNLCCEEEQQWRKWPPRVGDVVLVDTRSEGIWPGKILDKKVFFQGRTIPKGNNYFPVRIYHSEMEPTLTIKSRLLPLHLRPDPPLLSSETLQSSYHHAAHPSEFDIAAHAREQAAAHSRSHPGVGQGMEDLKKEKQRWNELVNWAMNERRSEKMRNLAEEREKRLRLIAVCPDEKPSINGHDRSNGILSTDYISGVGEKEDCPDSSKMGKKRRTSIPLPVVNRQESKSESPNLSGGLSIFGPLSTVQIRRTSSPLLSGSVRTGLGLATPTRPLSPRRLEKRRQLNGMSESPKRGSTWTPPRILPSGDETAPIPHRYTFLSVSNNGIAGDEMMERRDSPVPTGKFDFVSPLGPRHTNGDSNGYDYNKREEGGLNSVIEDPTGEEDGWTVVARKKRTILGRSESLPCLNTDNVASRVEIIPTDIEIQ